MIKAIVTIKRILYQKEGSPFAIILFRVEKGDDEIDKYITVKGDFPFGLDQNLWFEIEAESYIHEKHGLSYNLVDIKQTKINDEQHLVTYLSSSSFPSIGKKKAKLIVKELGLDAIEKIAKNPKILSDVKLKPAQRTIIIDVIMQNQEDHRMYKLFADSNVNKIYYRFLRREIGAKKFWEVVGEDIFSFYTLRIYIPVTILETLARHLNQEDLGKYHHYPLALIMDKIQTERHKTGHTIFEEDLIYSKVQESNYFTNIDFTSYIAELHEKRFLARVNEGEIQLFEDHQSEEIIAIAINKNKGAKRRGKIKLLPTLNELNKEQKEAIRLAISKPNLIITGAPGTGKTLVISEIVNQWIKTYKNPEYMVVAPTGRAAQVIKERIKVNAKTIHRFLGWNHETKEFIHNQNEPLNHRFLIIDEMSMVSQDLLAALLSALPFLEKLILVGDINQLPAIEAGNVFDDLIVSKLIPTIVLTINYRQQSGSQIITNAYNILEGNKLDYNRNDCYFAEIRQITQFGIASWIAKELSKDLYSTQILMPMYRGTWGIDFLNRIVQLIRWKHQKQGDLQIGQDCKFYIGDKVIQKINDYERDVYNGDIGEIIDVYKESKSEVVKVNFPMRKKVCVYTKAEFRDQVQLAYAISIHKAQGSEFKNVALIVDPSTSFMVNRNLLYTGWTRAKEKLYVVSTSRFLDIAMRKKLPPRRTNLLNKINSFSLKQSR